MLSDTFVVEALLNLSTHVAGCSEAMETSEKVSMTDSVAAATALSVGPISSSPPFAQGTSASLQMKRAIDIVQRYQMRGKILPHQLADRHNDPVLEQEHLDAQKLSKWRQSVKANKKMECSDEVRAYLDREILGWRDEVNSRKGMNRAVQIQKAREIVDRYKQRGGELPRKLADRSHPDREQEYKDAQKLTKWKQTLKGNGNSKYNCPDEIRDYLDEQMPHWRAEVREKNCFPMQFARDIVSRYHARGGVLPRQKSDYRRVTSSPTLSTQGVVSEESQQEYKDARKLHKWRQTLKGNGNGHNCSDEIRDFLDSEMPNWRDTAKQRVLVRRSVAAAGTNSVDADDVVVDADGACVAGTNKRTGSSVGEISPQGLLDLCARNMVFRSSSSSSEQGTSSEVQSERTFHSVDGSGHDCHDQGEGDGETTHSDRSTPCLELQPQQEDLSSVKREVPSESAPGERRVEACGTGGLKRKCCAEQSSAGGHRISRWENYSM